MEFRNLTSADLNSLLVLYEQLDAGNPECTAQQYKKVWEDIEGNANIQYFGAIEEGRVVSTCYAVYIPNLTHGGQGICFIENVVTDKAYRRRGLASRVINMAIAFAREHNCYKVILQSGASRTEAHRCYEKNGFNGESKAAFDMRLN